MLKRTWSSLFLWFVFVNICFSENIPQKINFQGRLLENGQPVTQSKNITFRIVDSSWQQVVENVSFSKDGIYQVELAIPLDTLKNNNNPMLEISVNGIPLTPTTRILSVPFTHVSEFAWDSSSINGKPVTGSPQTGDVLRWNGNAWIPDTFETTHALPFKLTEHSVTELTDMTHAGSGKIITDAERVKLSDIESGANQTTSARVEQAGAVMDSDFSGTGLLKKTGVGIYTTISDNSANWNTAYSERLKWDGSSNSLNASLARSSLELGSVSLRNVSSSVTNNNTIPDGAAIVSYVSSNVPNSSEFVSISGRQTITGEKTFDDFTRFNGNIQLGSSADGCELMIHNTIPLSFYRSGTQVGEFRIDNQNNIVLSNMYSGASFRMADDLYLQYSDSSSFKNLYTGSTYIHDDINFRDSSNKTYAYFQRMSDGLKLRVQEPDYISNIDYFEIEARINAMRNIEAYDDIQMHDTSLIFKNANNDAGSVQFSLSSNALNLSFWGSTYPSLFRVSGDLEITGDARKPGSSSWDTSSDARLKDIGNTFERGLDDLVKINPVHYHYKKDNPNGLPSDKEYIGVIAQNVEKAIPEAVKKDAKDYLIVNNDPIFWTMLNAIKTLKIENDQLKQELSKIKAHIGL